MFRVLAALSLLSAPLQAEMLDGADDPAFQAALAALLAADDPAAVASLRTLAEAGNDAALVTLPFALQWVPPVGTLKERNAQRQVGGRGAQDAAALVHAATALWNAGRVDDPMALPDRAGDLLARNEPEKAAVLLFAWVSQTGGLGEMRPEALSDDAPAMIGAYALSDRIANAAYANGPVQEEAARLLSLMRDDRLAAWVAYVQLLETQPGIFDTIGNPVAGTGLSAAETEARIEDARAVRAVWFGKASDDIATSAATAARARKALTGRAELLPVTRLCQAHCPDNTASCETAVLVYPGQPFGAIAEGQPFGDVLDPADFAASDRGLAALIPLHAGPTAATDRATAEGLDACYAAVLQRRDRISLGP